MDSALLSRFDLIFILVDRPNEEMDRFLSEHVMKLHSGKIGKAADMKSFHFSKGTTVPDARYLIMSVGTANTTPQQDSQSTSLLKRLKQTPGDELDLLPLPLLRKYIAYCRQYVRSRLSSEAAAVLQEFYLTLRSKHRSIDAAPITTRQLESMIRLSEARARCDMREVVTKEDAQDIIEIMKFSLLDTYSDAVGDSHFGRSQMGTGMSRKDDMKRFVGRLHDMYRRSSNDLFTYQQLYTIAQGTSRAISCGRSYSLDVDRNEHSSRQLS